jgi:3-oxoacyl-[acyl-carrier protein] reductase
MDLGLTGRTALVCGASAGLGLACAEALAEEGANVVMFAAGDQDADARSWAQSRGPIEGGAELLDEINRN